MFDSLTQEVERVLLDTLAAYYDIQPVEDGSPLRAICAFHSRDSKYVLVKSAELWAAERHEYLYLFSVPHLDAQALDSLWQRMLDDGLPRIRPHSQHMYTYLTAVVLYDTAEPQALEQLKKLRQRREFKLSLHGWMESRIAAVELASAALATNRSGKALKGDFQRMVTRAISKCKERRNHT